MILLLSLILIVLIMIYLTLRELGIAIRHYLLNIQEATRDVRFLMSRIEKEKKKFNETTE